MSKSMFEIIRRQNGEAFARAIRDFDSGIFEIENLPEILKFAGRNPLVLLKFLKSLKTKIKSQKVDTLDPFVLLKRAGYDAFYADNLEKQNSIRPYFKEDEELCTFIDSSRYKNYHILHCIKEGAEDIKRENYLGIEERDDSYGTSVISIQMLKTGGFIKITNRYNHTVPGCDNTFNSNPENIIAGLTQALQHHFDVTFSVGNVNVPNGFVFQNGCLYQYQYEMNNCYIGRDFYLKDGVVFPLEKDSQMMVDSFVFDLKNREIQNPSGAASHLFDVLKEETKGSVWQVEKRVNRHVLFVDKREVLSTENGFLKTLFLRKTEVAKEFLSHHKDIEEVHGYSLLQLQEKSLDYCPKLSYVHLPRCEEVGKKCFEGVSANIEAPLLKKQGVSFISGVGIDANKNELISQGVIPFQLYDFLKRNMNHVSNICVTELLNGCMVYMDEKPFMHFKDNKLVGLWLPETITVLEKAVMMDISDLKEFSAPGVHLVEDANFLRCHHLEKLDLPQAKYIGYNCLNTCPAIEELNLPKLEKISTGTSLCNNHKLKYVYAPKLYLVPDFYLLPALERFDCEKGVYLRKTPVFIAGDRMPQKRFAFMAREEQNER